MESNTFNLNKLKRKYRKKKQRQKFIKILFIISIIILFISIPIIKSINEKNTISARFMLTSNNELPQKKFTICIDPGHGDWDIGATGATGTYEKDIVLAISLKLGKLLEDNKIKVIYTRADDLIPWVDTANDSLKERLQISKISNADLFLSIHCNSSNNINTRGVETWYNPVKPESKYFSSLLQTELAHLDYTSNRGLKTYVENEELAVLELNNTVASLVELGFITNIIDESFLISEEGQKKCAQALFTAIVNYLNEL